MTTIQTGSIVMGIARQAVAGTPADHPAYIFGVEEGNIGVDIEREADELTSASSVDDSVSISGIAEPFNLTTRAYPGSIGAILLAALGAVVTTGSGPYTHIFDHKRPLPYITVFKKHGGGEIHRGSTAKVDSLKLEWEGNAPLSVALDGQCAGFDFPSTITPVTDEIGSPNALTPVGGTFKLAVSGTTPATAKIKGGSIELGNNVEAEVYSGAYVPQDTTEGWHEANCAFTVVPENLDQWRTLLTGSSSGTDIVTEPVLGSFEVTFVKGAVTLKVEANKVSFAMEAPPAEARGGKWETELGGICLRPSGWAGPVKFTLTNAVASYTA